MADEQLTIASAVIVPEETNEPAIPLAPSKRRQSSIDSSTSKRPRLSNDAAAAAADDDKISSRLGGESRATHTPNSLNERRKSGQAEERKRGQRLFGALLGTLSQSSSSTAQKRRLDIEKKQQAKLKLQSDEYDEKKKKELDELKAIRKVEQRKFVEQSMHTHHSNLLSMAHFLRTTTEPRLFYKPWELKPDEEKKIKLQIEEAESTIALEVKNFHSSPKPAETDSPLEEEERPEQQQLGTAAAADVKREEEEEEEEASPATGNETETPNVKETVGSEHIIAESTDDDALLKEHTNGNSAPKPHPNPDTPRKQLNKHDTTMGIFDGADGGEVVFVAEEDTVIY